MLLTDPGERITPDVLSEFLTSDGEMDAAVPVAEGADGDGGLRER